MADFTKAGQDRGDLEKELEHILISVKMLLRTYSAGIEDLTQEELSYDLLEYRDQMSRFILPLVKKAEETKSKKLINLAYEIRYTQEKLIALIEERLTAF